MSSTETAALLATETPPSTGEVDCRPIVLQSRWKRTLDFCRKLPFLVILTCVFNAIGNGYTYSTSYLIIPVSSACSPPWSHTATVYGASAVSAGWMVGSMLGIFAVRKHVRLYYVMSIILYCLGLGLAGVMVLTCHQTALAGELLYIATFCLYGISTMLVYFANFEFAMLSMPNWPGFSGGIHGLSVGVGELLLSQIIILLRETFSDFHVNAGTIFFCLAILKIIFSAPWLPLVAADCEHMAPIDKVPHTVEQRVLRRLFGNYKLWLLSIGVFAGIIAPVAVIAVQEPLLRALWSENNAPINVLSAVVMSSFLFGRLLCVLFSDKIGMKRVWIIALLAQAAFLCSLGFIMQQHNDRSMKYVGIAVFALYFMIFPAFKSTMAGLSHEVFGMQYRIAALGVLSLVWGAAGLVGPVAIDTMYNSFNSYRWFFFGSAGLSVIGGVAILAAPTENVSRVQDATSDHASDE